jgi:hypothetical protein
MSSVGVLIEKKILSIFVRGEKKNKCPMKKFSKCEERGRKKM